MALFGIGVRYFQEMSMYFTAEKRYDGFKMIILYTKLQTLFGGLRVLSLSSWRIGA